MATKTELYWLREDDLAAKQIYRRQAPVNDDVVENDVVRWDATIQKYVPAVATQFNSAVLNENIHGIAVHVNPTTREADIFVRRGLTDAVAGFTGLTAGADYWLSPTLPGKITTTRPNTQPLIRIGRAVSTTQLLIDIVEFRFDPICYVPINYARKDAHVSDWSLSTGSSTVSFTSSDSRFGFGCYQFTGTGTWNLNAVYPAASNIGLGGYYFARTSTSTGTISVGVEQYDANLAFLGNLDVVSSGQSINTGWQYFQALNQSMNASTRFVRPRFLITTNPGTIFLDGWMMFLPNFGRITEFSNNAQNAVFATTANYA